LEIIMPRSSLAVSLAANNVLPFRGNSPVHMQERLDRCEELSVIERLSVTQLLSRKWRRFLSDSQFKVLSYIVDRTVGWGRGWFSASYDNILIGTSSYAGVGVSRATLYRCLSSLEELGAVRRFKIGSRVRIYINLTWCPMDKPTDDTSDDTSPSIPVPKRLRSGLRSGLTVRPEQSHSETLNTVSLNTSNEDSLRPDGPALGVRLGGHVSGSESLKPVTEGIEVPNEQTVSPEDYHARLRARLQKPSGVPLPPVRVRVRSGVQPPSHCAGGGAREAREEQAAALKTKIEEGKALNATTLERVWRQALVDHAVRTVHVNWSVKQKAQVKLALSKWAYSRHGTMADLVRFAVREWNVIVARRFKWMTQRPAPLVPTLDFFLWRLGDFVEEWASGEVRAFANADAQASYEQLRARGLSDEEAIAELSKREAVVSLRQEMDQRDRSARAKLEDASRKLHEAGKLERLQEAISRKVESGEVPNVKVLPARSRIGGQVWGYQPAVVIPKPDVPSDTIPDTTRDNHFSPPVMQPAMQPAMRPAMQPVANPAPLPPLPVVTLPPWEQVQGHVARTLQAKRQAQRFATRPSVEDQDVDFDEDGY
jgi:hypothetical protein